MNRKVLFGVGAMLVVLGLVVWAMWPGSSEVRVAEEVAESTSKTKKAKRKVLLAQGDVEIDEDLPLEEDPSIPVVTKTCKWIVEDERRNVPQWVMLDNLRDRGQLFVEDDLRCLTAAGVTPAILDFAERYQDRNALRRKEKGE